MATNRSSLTEKVIFQERKNPQNIETKAGAYGTATNDQLKIGENNQISANTGTNQIIIIPVPNQSDNNISQTVGQHEEQIKTIQKNNEKNENEIIKLKNENKNLKEALNIIIKKGGKLDHSDCMAIFNKINPK